jgi:hypothetical protein
MSVEKSAGMSSHVVSLRCSHWPEIGVAIIGFLSKPSTELCLFKPWRTIMPKSAGKPKSTEAEGESSNSENLDQTDSGHTPQKTGPAPQEPADSEAAVRSKDWWVPSLPVGESAKPTNADFVPTKEVDRSKESATADVYFCGRTTLFPLNRALQAIAKEELTGTLRAFWDQEPIELLAKEGTIVFVTTRDPELYCPDTPAVLANVDAETIAKARAQQSETGVPFFLTLARQESIARQPAMELVQYYGQKLFSQLWAAPVWIMFEKNAGLLSDAPEVSAEQTVDNWALETLRFVENVNQHANFDPTSIPAYTKDGFERVQKLKLTSDEAQFASQFNGSRSVQQIAKNLRLDLKSAHLMLFRFLALEIVECWPASTATKPEPKSVFHRFRRAAERDR